MTPNDPLANMSQEDIDKISAELDAIWKEALKTAPPATVRGYYHTIVKMHRAVFLYGIIGMSFRMGVAPADIMAILDDDADVTQVAAERGISLEGCESVTDEELRSYRQTYSTVYSSYIADGILPPPTSDAQLAVNFNSTNRLEA